MLEHCLAAFGQANSPGTLVAPRTALDQGQIKLLLQFPHSLRDRRLADIQSFRGAGKAALVGDLKKNAKQMQIHNYFSYLNEIYVLELCYSKS